MSEDCVQCREWELCPFHPKQEPAQDEWDEPTDIVWNLASDVPEVNVLTVSTTGPTIISGGGGVSRTCLTYAVTADGQYVQTWQDGKLVDEEPIEAYQPWHAGYRWDTVQRNWVPKDKPWAGNAEKTALMATKETWEDGELVKEELLKSNLGAPFTR